MSITQEIFLIFESEVLTKQKEKYSRTEQKRHLPIRNTVIMKYKQYLLQEQEKYDKHLSHFSLYVSQELDV